MSKIYLGESGKAWHPNGSTIRDDGAIFYDFSAAIFDPDEPLVRNYGAMKSYGDGTIENGTILTEFDDRVDGMFYAFSNDGARIKFLTDVTMYGNFSLSFWLRGIVPQNRSQIYHYHDATNHHRFEFYAENGRLHIIFQRQELSFTHEIQPEDRGSFFVLAYDSYATTFSLYRDAVLIQSITIDIAKGDEGTFENPNVQFDAEQANFEQPQSFEKEGHFSETLQEYDRNIPSYLFNDPTGSYPLAGLQIAAFRLYATDITPDIIQTLFERNETNINIPAQTRFLGEFKRAPTTGFLYDFFRWIGRTNNQFIDGEFYRRTLSGWELFKVARY